MSDFTNPNACGPGAYDAIPPTGSHGQLHTPQAPQLHRATFGDTPAATMSGPSWQVPSHLGQQYRDSYGESRMQASPKQHLPILTSKAELQLPYPYQTISSFQAPQNNDNRPRSYNFEDQREIGRSQENPRNDGYRAFGEPNVPQQMFAPSSYGSPANAYGQSNCQQQFAPSGGCDDFTMSSQPSHFQQFTPPGGCDTLNAFDHPGCEQQFAPSGSHRVFPANDHSNHSQEQQFGPMSTIYQSPAHLSGQPGRFQQQQYSNRSMSIAYQSPAHLSRQPGRFQQQSYHQFTPTTNQSPAYVFRQPDHLDAPATQ